MQIDLILKSDNSHPVFLNILQILIAVDRHKCPTSLFLNSAFISDFVYITHTVEALLSSHPGEWPFLAAQERWLLSGGTLSWAVLRNLEN